MSSIPGKQVGKSLHLGDHSGGSHRNIEVYLRSLQIWTELDRIGLPCTRHSRPLNPTGIVLGSEGSVLQVPALSRLVPFEPLSEAFLYVSPVDQ